MSSGANTNRGRNAVVVVVATLGVLLAFLGGRAFTRPGSELPPIAPAGSGSVVAAPPTAPSGEGAQGPGAARLSKSRPVAVDIPRIGARSSLVELGLKQDRSLEVPPVSQPMQAGWYRNGPTPGEPGPAVILGHVDGSGSEGIFYRLGQLKPNDVINVQREDGTVARFAVQHVDRAPKSNFPTAAVYGSTPDPQLRVITCGGAFDRKAHSYLDNVIVFATLISSG